MPLSCTLDRKVLELPPEPAEEDRPLDCLHELAPGEGQGHELADFRLLAPPASLPRQEVPHVPVLGVSVQIIIRVRPVLRRNGVFQWCRGGQVNAGLWCSSGPRVVAAQVRLSILARRDAVEVPGVALAFTERLPVSGVDVPHLLLVVHAGQLFCVVPYECVHPLVAEHGPCAVG